MEERIRKAIESALIHAGVPQVSLYPFTIDRPAVMSHGDYYTNAALVKAKLLHKKPRELAEEIVKELKNNLGDSVSEIEIAGSGFVNITLSRGTVASVIGEAVAKGGEWGKGVSDKNFRTIVEYSNPNAFKEMHVGHLVGTVVGEAIARLIENAGGIVARDTFGGDIGPNVAKALWGLRKRGITEPTMAQEIGAAYTEGSTAYEGDPRAKEEIDALNQAIYAGTDHELMELWRKGRDVSMEEFRRIWKLLGTHFDPNLEFFDSQTTKIGLEKVNEGLEKGVFKKGDGNAIIYDGEKKGVHTMVFVTSHNTPTYEAKDIGLAFLKEERWPSNKTVVITGNEQTGRFKTVLAALGEINKDLADKTEHVPTGFLRLASGKMSSREGNVITANEFIQSVIKKAGEKNADPLIAEEVGIGAIKYMILRQAPGSDIIFDPEKSLSLTGDSGTYLQYALVRAKSVIQQAGGSKQGAGEQSPKQPYLIERITLHFPEVAEQARNFYMPNLLVNYLTELAGEWNSFYAQERIIGGDHEAHKLMLARAFVNTMMNGLTVLGIPVPEKM